MSGVANTQRQEAEAVPGSRGAGGRWGASANACTVPPGVMKVFLTQERLHTLVNILKPTHGTVWGHFMLHELHLNKKLDFKRRKCL